MNTSLHDFIIYNPGSIPKEALLEEFTARHAMLEEILSVIAENGPEEPQQHLSLEGPRGMGKTATLWVIAYRVEDDPALNKEWLPIVFSEENYGIGDLADFWLEALRHLEGTLGLTEDRAEELLKENPRDLANRAREGFLELLSRQGKRAILLLDNLNEIFNSITDEEELHDLRAFLMENTRVMVIGSAATYFSQSQNLDQPFFDFFRVFHLERFKKNEMEEVLLKIAKKRNNQKVIEILEKEPERIHTLRILTGGNPRLVKMVYRLLHEGAFEDDVRQDLQRLLDDCTPYFKHRIEGLGTQPRRVFDAIARRWDPTSVGELSLSLRKPSNYISSQIKRLVEEGFVEEAGGTEKKKTYQVAERFYNIYYLMRYSRSGRRRLDWLVGFMKVFYKLDDYRKWAEVTEGEARRITDPARREERLSYLSSLASATEDAGLRKELLHKAIKATIDTGGFQALSRIIDTQMARKELGPHFSILEFLGGLPKDQRKSIDYKPEDSRWWFDITKILRKKRFYSLAEEAYRKAIELDPKGAECWNNLGNLLQDHSNRYKEAEFAYRKAIKLDLKSHFLYCNLADLLHKIENRRQEALEPAIQGVCLCPGNAWTRTIFLKVCPDSPDPWLQSLPKILEYVAETPKDEEVYQFALDGLIRLVRYGKSGEVFNLIETAKVRDLFDPLVMALKANSDRGVLASLAPERRALVLEVMEKIKESIEGAK